MTLLADWFNLLRFCIEYDQDEPLSRTLLPILSILSITIYSILLIVEGYYYPLILIVGFALGVLFFGSNANHSFPEHAIRLLERDSSSTDVKVTACSGYIFFGVVLTTHCKNSLSLREKTAYCICFIHP